VWSEAASFRYLEWVVGLERVLEYELALDLDLLVLDIVLQPRHLVHGPYVLRVDLRLEQVEIVDLAGRVALTGLFRRHLRLRQVDPLHLVAGSGSRLNSILIYLFICFLL